MRLWLFFSLGIPVVKFIIGTYASYYFNNPFVGGWWAGVVTMLLFVVAQFGFENIGTIVFGAVASVFAVAVTAVAVVADARLAHYFTYVIQKCSYDDGKVHCFCEETKSDFSEVFHNAGDIRCNNPFTKNTDFLLANFILSIGCLVLSSLLLLCFLVWCVGGLCSSTCCNVHVYPDSDSSYPARSPAFPNNGSYQRIPLTSSRGAELL